MGSHLLIRLTDIKPAMEANRIDIPNIPIAVAALTDTLTFMGSIVSAAIFNLSPNDVDLIEVEAVCPTKIMSVTGCESNVPAFIPSTNIYK